MIYGVIGGIFLAVAIFMGGVKAGRAYEENTTIKADLTRAAKVIVKQEVLIREVPKIVVRVVEREKQVEKEVERVVEVIRREVPRDCVLPERFSRVLIDFARKAADGAPGDADAPGAEYGCAEVLEATTADLGAGYKNTAALAGLQRWARLVTEETQ